MSEQIRVLVIDDSAFMRKSLTLLIESDPDIKVIGTARDGQDGIDKIRHLKPDIVTLDIEMPRMDGLTALRIIMKECPLPVLMVSSMTTEGAEVTIKGMELGAVDFIPKHLSYVSLDIVKIKDDLLSKIHAIHQSRCLQKKYARPRTGRPSVEPTTVPVVPSLPVWDGTSPGIEFSMVAIGISTGGPFALHSIIPKIPKAFPKGIVIVQHMPPKFTKSLADRLNNISEIEVKEAEEGDVIRRGLVLIAPGGLHVTFKRNDKNEVAVHLSEEPSDTLHRPSVDVMMKSAAEVSSPGVLGVIMTGMGKDGLEGLRVIRKKNGFIIAQNEETCVVYGMPRAAVEAGLSDVVAPLEQIPQILTSVVH
jgi:two-component system, chemotaxis family, protein-glutamate methylesterase/glutaminase